MPLRTNPRHWPALAAILALAAGATAQTTVPGSGAPVTLSPFQVTEGQDQGYAATQIGRASCRERVCHNV